MQYSVIINCYNTMPLIKKCLSAAIDTTDKSTEIIMINNHPPFKDAREFLKKINHPRVRVLDPGKNIGCNLGFNYGAEHANGKYLVKLDDDIVVPRNNWIEVMSKALNDFPDLAYVGLTPSDIRKNGNHEQTVKPKYIIEFTEFVLFCCVMMEYSSWKNHFYIPSKLGLYGYDDVYCAGKAKKLGLRIAYLTSHICEHLRHSTEADPLYQIWKKHYAHKERIKLDYVEWRKKFINSDEGKKLIEELVKIGRPVKQPFERGD